MHTKSAKRSLPVLIAVAVVVLVAVGFAVLHFTKAQSHAQPGDCVTVSNDTDVAAANCGGTGSMYKVGKVLASASESCPGGEDSDYYEVTDGAGQKMCLMPKVAEGTCLELDGTFGVKQDCTGEYAAKVTKVVAGKADEAACGDSGEAMVFAEPPTTVCLSIPQAQ
ncbi:LppU/SCO3897 family protein [Lentzea nigeriaca]|uniref:LppU/SCO3897 family protein n=1 Tax=Lentzea nigeriaca TaxID=1128665 RepID=UPI00195D9633|nr:hypothetical protein [Lentzea nigeriaca]MBM7863808.1 hypothetical protein [Lentzea nigeriaca]